MNSQTPDPPQRSRFRSLLAPVHPRRLWNKVRHIAHRLGYYRLRLWVIALDPRRLVATWRFFLRLRSTMAERRREPRLTIGVDISAFWQPLTGIGWYLYRLLEHLAERDDVRLRLYGLSLIDKEGLAAPVVEIPRGPALEHVTYRVPENLSIVHYYLADRLRLSQDRLVAGDGNQVLFAPNYFLPPWFDRARGRLVATVHDLAILRVPETMHEHTREQLTQHLERTLSRTARVLTDTEAVRQELIATGKVDAQRIHAVHLGPGSVASVQNPRPPQGTPQDFALHVGTLEPRKNLPLLLAAWRLWRAAQGSEIPNLVLCGGFGWKTEALKEQIQQAEAEGWLRHFGYLDDDEVAGLYSAARCLVMPTLYEGFGLPLVEAMAFGVPIVCSDLPVLREVAGEAAIYVSSEAPQDELFQNDPSRDAVASWHHTLSELWGDAGRLEALAARSSLRADAFDWRHTAQRTVEVWQASVGSPTDLRSTDPATDFAVGQGRS